MDIKEFTKKSLEIKKLYAELEKKKYGKEWASEKYFESLVADIGDFSRLILSREGTITDADFKRRVEHELSDLFLGILILAGEYDIDIENAFLDNMEILEKRISNESNSLS